MAKPISILNHVLGPVMRGPSSSHSAGALRIGRLCRDLLGGDVNAIDCEYDPNGSLATTHKSQGSDMGLAGGLLGWEASDARLPDYRQHSEDSGLRLNVNLVDYGAIHPNTYRLRIHNSEESRSLTALSVGGGMIEVIDIDGLHVSLEGDQNVLIAYSEEDKPISIKTSRHAFGNDVKAQFKKETGAEKIRHLQPVMLVCWDDETQVPFHTASEMLLYDAGHDATLPELALKY